MLLDFARHSEVALHPLFFAGYTLVEAGILDSDGHLCCQRDDRAHVVLDSAAHPWLGARRRL